MRRGRSATVATTILVAIAAGPAGAQLIDPLPAGLKIGARVQTAYESNLLRLADDQIVPAGQSRDDVTTTIAGVIRGELTPGLQRIHIDAEYGRVKFAQNDFLASSYARASGGLDWQLGTRCSGAIDGNFSRGQADLADQGIIARNTRDVLSVGANGGCRIGLAFRPTIGVRRRSIDNSNPIRFATDSKTQSANIGLAYDRTGNTGISVGLRTERYDYPGRFNGTGGAGLRVVRRAAGARFNHDFAAGASFSVTGDYNWLRTDLVAGQRHELSGGITMSYRPIPRYGFSVNIEREIDASFFVAAGYVRRDRAEIVSYYTIGPRTRLNLRGAILRNRFRDQAVIPGAAIRSFDRSRTATATLSYRVLRGADIVLETQYNDRSTDAVFGNYDGVRSSVSFRVIL